MIDDVALVMMNIEGSKIYSPANSLWCFIGKFTELSESELPNPMMNGVT